jgi:hypothetical protein
MAAGASERNCRHDVMITRAQASAGDTHECHSADGISLAASACFRSHECDTISFGLGEIRERLPMLLRWLDYDPLAVVVLAFGIGAILLLALSM